MLRLQVQSGDGEILDLALKGENVVIGRATDCDVVLDDRFLSRRHTRLSRRGEVWWAEDMGSRNGTSVNGRRITEPVRIGPGDELQISGTRLRVCGEEADSPPPPRVDDASAHTIFKPAADLLRESAALPAEDAEAAEVLRGHAERLRLLNEVHQALSQPIELADLLDLILARAFEHLKPEEGVIFLKDAKGGYYRAAFRSAADIGSDQLYSATLLDEVAERGLAALVLDVASDERFAAAQSILDAGVRSLVAAPLLDPAGSLGMIALSSRLSRRRFVQEDMELLVSLASVAALRIRNVALAEEAAERRRLEQEVRLARTIQVALLPDKLPDLPGWSLYGGNLPSQGVSGDYYLVTERREGDECILMVADVSGKGIGAALLTASLEALAAGPIAVGRPPEDICARTSRRLFRRTPPAKYATAFVAVLEVASGRLAWANAGHNDALLVRRGGEVERLGATGLPLGLLPRDNYTAQEATLEPGDLLVLYTDGITEASDPEDEEYGIERLAALCREGRGEPLEALAERVEKDLDAFARGVPFADDRTLVMVRRDAGENRSG